MRRITLPSTPTRNVQAGSHLGSCIASLILKITKFNNWKSTGRYLVHPPIQSRVQQSWPPCLNTSNEEQITVSQDSLYIFRQLYLSSFIRYISPDSYKLWRQASTNSRACLNSIFIFSQLVSRDEQAPGPWVCYFIYYPPSIITFHRAVMWSTTLGAIPQSPKP